MTRISYISTVRAVASAFVFFAAAFAGVPFFGNSQAAAGVYSGGTATSGAVDAAIPKTSAAFVSWATSVVNYLPTAGVSSAYQKSSNALGKADGSIVSLGDLYSTAAPPTVGAAPPFSDTGTAYSGNPYDTTDGFGFIGIDSPGSITLAFNAAITNGEGADFAVFENGFASGSKLSAELAYVEVSTDGLTFARFAGVSLTGSAVGAYGTIDPTDVYNLAGKNAAGYGTPFDLSTLATADAVLSGAVNLSNINYVRLVDIPGSGYFTDSLGNPIYDSWVTKGSGGFDLDAVGVVNQVPEPISALMTLAGIAALVFARRRQAEKRFA